jgi:hypothetical protein
MTHVICAAQHSSMLGMHPLTPLTPLIPLHAQCGACGLSCPWADMVLRSRVCVFGAVQGVQRAGVGGVQGVEGVQGEGARMGVKGQCGQCVGRTVQSTTRKTTTMRRRRTAPPCAARPLTPYRYTTHIQQQTYSRYSKYSSPD